MFSAPVRLSLILFLAAASLFSGLQLCRHALNDLLFYRISDNSMTSLVGNAGLAERRKRIFDSQLHTLNQYRNYLEKAEYAEIVLTRIFEERWLAVEYHLTDWEAELWVQWKQFSGWADLPAGKRLRFRLYSGRQRIKKCLYRQKFAAKDRN